MFSWHQTASQQLGQNLTCPGQTLTSYTHINISGVSTAGDQAASQELVVNKYGLKYTGMQSKTAQADLVCDIL